MKPINGLKEYWFELLIVIVLTIFPYLWSKIRPILQSYGLPLPAGFYFLCEIFYDFTALMAVYHLGILQKMWSEIREAYQRKEYKHTLAIPTWWFRRVVKIVFSLPEQMKTIEFKTQDVRRYFRWNRFVALIQPSVTMVLVFLYTDLPQLLSIAVYLFLCADLISTVVIIVEAERRLGKREQKIDVRLAKFDDLQGVLEVDADRYATIDQAVTATEAMMKTRISVSNYEHDGWFWVAEVGGKIVGLLSLQPTTLGPDDFVSWDHSTDKGTLESTFQIDGENIYVVAATTKLDAPNTTFDLLVAAGVKKWFAAGKNIAYFCARMPDYYRHSDYFTPEEYCEAKISKDGKQAALDRQIRLYEQMGFQKLRLVENAMPEDYESKGYGVLFMSRNPFRRLPLPFAQIVGWMVGKIFINRFMLRLFT